MVVDRFPACAGVAADMTLEEALSYDAGTVVLDADEPFYQRAFRRVLTVLQGVSDRAAEQRNRWWLLPNRDELGRHCYGRPRQVRREMLNAPAAGSTDRVWIRMSLPTGKFAVQSP